MDIPEGTGNLPREMFTPQDEGQGSAPAPSQEPQAPAGNEPKTEGTPTSDAPAGEPSQPQDALYELPDGRKVDAETLQKEWKENFLPDYTRKSQALAEYEKGKPPQPNINNEQKVPYWEDPEWVPKSYAEIVKASADKAVYDAEQQEKAQAEATEAIKNMVDAQLAEIKKLDPNVDENLIFTHANKYKFPNLISAYQNMVDMNVAVKKTQQQTEKNLRQREADPVATGSGEPASDGIDYGAIQGRSVQDAALDHLARIKGN